MQANMQRIWLAVSGRVGGRMVAMFLLWGFSTTQALAHDVSDVARERMQNGGILDYIWTGAEHMLTGYDHLLFLFGVIFFLYRLKDVGVYVTLFAIGHSSTLLFGVLSSTHVNPYLVDAVIGLSVVYKALDNLGAFPRWFGVQPNTKAAVLIFGFFHAQHAQRDFGGVEQVHGVDHAALFFGCFIFADGFVAGFQ